MKRWMVILIIGTVVFAILGYLYVQGDFEEYGWESAAIVLAAVTGPVKMLIYWASGNENKDRNLKIAEQNFTKTKENKDMRNNRLSLQIKEKELSLTKLEKDVELLSANIELLAAKHKSLKTDIS